MKLLKTRSDESAEEPPDSSELLTPDYIQGLRHALSSRGNTYSLPMLMGLSGETFRFYFSGRDPLAGAATVGHNPLRAAAMALGFDCKVKSATDVAAAAELLSAELKDGKGPVILKTSESWLVIESQDEDSQLFNCWKPGNQETKLEKEKLIAIWPESAGLLELGATGYYFFLLGEKSRDGEIKDAAMGAMRRAYRQIFRVSKVEGCSGGLNAYQELSQIIKRKRRTAQRANDLYKYALWHSTGMPELREARRAAVLFLEELRQTFSHEDEEKPLLKALQCYRLMLTPLDSLPVLHERVVKIFSMKTDSLREEKHKARLVRALWLEKRRILHGIKKLWQLERNAVEELQHVVEETERRGRESSMRA
jgi:hypothetical protein